jgi:hypothetical protein
LGKPGAQIRPWERRAASWKGSGSASVPAAFEEPLRALLADMADWQKTMHRFYQLLRHLVLANELCKPEVWSLEPHLLVIVNELNKHALRTHAQEFAQFGRCLRLPPERRSAAKGTRLVTWQALLARAQGTFDPGVRPLLAHAARLSYLRLIVRGGPERHHS